MKRKDKLSFETFPRIQFSINGDIIQKEGLVSPDYKNGTYYCKKCTAYIHGRFKHRYTITVTNVLDTGYT